MDDQSLYLTSGTTLRRMTAGYNALAADFYWIRTIQFYGDVKLRLARIEAGVPDTGRARDYSQLYPLLDVTTTLDPHFKIAYRFGAIFLAEAYPGGAGRPDLAVALLEKGLRDRPDRWEYMQDIGFVHYWWRRDYKAAAEWFARASQVPGAPWWLRSLAATTLAEGGDRRSSRLMWESIRQSAEVDWLRRDAERRLLQFQALDDIDGLQARADRLAAAADAIRGGAAPGAIVSTHAADITDAGACAGSYDPRLPPFMLVSNASVAGGGIGDAYRRRRHLALVEGEA